MVHSNPPEDFSTNDSLSAPIAPAESNATLPDRSYGRQPRWVPALGLLLLLLGLGFGWRWWQSSQAGAPGGAEAGMGQMQGAPVELETIESAPVQESSEFIGSLEAQSSVEIRPEFEGRVSAIYVTEGQVVAAGDPLIQLSPDQREADYASVLASVNSARASRASARAELERVKATRLESQAEVALQQETYQRRQVLVQEGALAQDQLDQTTRDLQSANAQLQAANRQIAAAEAAVVEAEAGVQQAQANADRANADLQDATINAPQAGVVGDIPIKLGAVVATSDTLTTVTRNQSLDLNLSVPLERSPDLSLGQQVELVDAQGNVLQSGRVSFIAPQVESNAQSLLAKATFDNANGGLRDGQFVRARVIWSEGTGVLVPTTAISRLAGEAFVFVAEPAPPPEEGQAGQPPAAQGQAPAGEGPALVAKQRRVQLGNLQGNRYQVLEGLNPGEQIVTSGVLNLSDGIPIFPAPPPGSDPEGAPGGAAQPPG